MHKILISSCLLGNPVRYDGNSQNIDHPLIRQWQNEGRLVSVCPEVSGGLPVPRPPAELQIVKDGEGENIQVITIDGLNVTQAFGKGAAMALQLCRQHQIQMAILKQSSPSCGSQQIYDGRFSGVKVPGEGLTCRLLRQHGITVFSEQTLHQAADFLSTLTPHRI